MAESRCRDTLRPIDPMKRWRTLVAILFGGMVLGGLLLFSRSDPFRLVLPDGRVLTLVGVQTGVEHYAPMGGWRQRLARRLPVTWNRWLKITPPPQTRYRSTNYLSVWLLVEGTNHSSATTFSPYQPPFELLLGDEDGSFTCHAEHNGSAVEVALGPGRSLIGLPVAAWPRRAETIDIQVFPRWNNGKPLAVYRVKNPSRDLKTPPWAASPWPITVTNEDMEFTLTSLWLGLSHPPAGSNTLVVTRNPKDRMTRATFRVTRGGEWLTNWNAYHVRTIEDATGNWSDGNSFISGMWNGETFNQFGRPPLPAREAWRMKVEFSRLSGFETGELVEVRGVSVPPNGAGGSQTNDFGSNKIEFRWEPVRTGSSEPPGFWATVRPAKNDYKLTLLSARDNQGREVRCKNPGGGQSVTMATLELQPDAKSVDLVFAFHASRIVTFQAKPEFYRPQTH